MIEPLLSAVLAFSLSQVLLSLILLVRRRSRWLVQEKLFGCFLIATACYLAFPFVKGFWVAEFVVFIHTLLPGIFWLICGSLFNDKFRLRPWKIAVIALTAILPFISKIVGDPNSLILVIFLNILPQGIEFLFLGAAFILVTRFWRVDLVQTRRDLRLWLCALVGPYIFTLILLRAVIFPEAEWLAFWQYVPASILCLISNLLLLQYKSELLNRVIGSAVVKESGIEPSIQIEIAPSDESADTVEVPESFTQNLENLMRNDHIYREMGLTIGDLAKELKVPEYRLRKIINTGLGYRNFNDFLNGYRIQEAGERLADPKHTEETILNVALDIGFRSLSSFNKAFKERYGQTPTEYRSAHPAKLGKND